MVFQEIWVFQPQKEPQIKYIINILSFRFKSHSKQMQNLDISISGLGSLMLPCRYVADLLLGLAMVPDGLRDIPLISEHEKTQEH